MPALALHHDVVDIHLSPFRVDGKSLGRHVKHDPRSLGFPAERADYLRDVRHALVGLPFDQGAHECSTAHALCGALNGLGEGSERPPLRELDAIRVFRHAAVLNGDDPDARSGSSALMACKSARDLGLISEFRHAFGLEHALHALVLRPVMTGITWYSSFDQPAASGLVEVSRRARPRGGHEVIAHALDVKNELVWCWNSWGSDYGVGGRFCMSFETWGRLLNERGDVTVPLR
jgi:hypothetical protein